MVTISKLQQFGITKYRLRKFFKHMGYPISQPTLDGRFKNQDWSYAHGYLLKQAGLWIEPPLAVTDDDMAMLYNDKRFLDSEDEEGQPLPNMDVDHTAIVHEPTPGITVTIKK